MKLTRNEKIKRIIKELVREDGKNINELTKAEKADYQEEAENWITKWNWV